MSKDKRKKKFFQGMEHLQSNDSFSSPVISVQHTSVMSENEILQHKYVKGDLFRVISLVVFLLCVLGGLMYLDQTTSKVQYMAEKITSIVIR